MIYYGRVIKLVRMGLCTQQVEVKSLHIGTKISINRKGITTFAVFLLSIFAGIRRKAVSGVGCRSPPANLDFQKNSDWQAVKYAPRKVYIKESGSYTELSYKEFYNRRETDRAYADKLFIPVQGCLIETEQAHYIEFYRDKERWRYLKKLDADNSLLSLEAFESDDDNSIEFIADEAVNVAETVVHRMMLERLRSALAMLSEDEQKLVNAIFFQELSEREWSSISGIPQKTINDRKRKILAKLKKILEK